MGSGAMNKLETSEVLVVDIPRAGAMAGMTPARSYAAARDGYMPTIKVSKGRMKVPLAKWRAILNGEAAA
jgi:hypothetical protein